MPEKPELEKGSIKICQGCGREEQLWTVKESDKVDAPVVGEFCLKCIGDGKGRVEKEASS